MPALPDNGRDAHRDLDILMSACVSADASDLHLVPGMPPHFRKSGELLPTPVFPALDAPRIRQMAIALLPPFPPGQATTCPDLDAALGARGALDGAISSREGARFRFNIFRRQSQIAIALRRLEDRFRTLRELGLPEELYRLCDLRDGLVVISGPTGAGKSTTLAALLDRINRQRTGHLITIEDPIEYLHAPVRCVINQRQVGLDVSSFNSALVDALRQDPDVILVGEIRDRETAEIAIQSSLTGHLVFSTLHTNDAASAVTRLIDMGIEPFLVASSVIAIVAQRLVRVLCPRCKEPYVPDDESLRDIGFKKNVILEYELFRRKGCPACMNTGYRGRTAIFEILIMDENVKKLILRTTDANQINEEAVKRGMETLIQDGARKVLQGITTIEEVLRVTRILNREAALPLLEGLE